MSVRATHIIDDIQRCLYQLLYTLSTTTSPWTDWTVILGFPEEEVLDQFAEPIIYVMAPAQVGRVRHQGENAATYRWRLTVGAWLHRKHGGPEELNIIGSRLMKLFEDTKTACRDTTFTVTLGSNTYSNTNLRTMGIYVEGIEGPTSAYVADDKEFRDEYNMLVLA